MTKHSKHTSEASAGKRHYASGAKRIVVSVLFALVGVAISVVIVYGISAYRMVHQANQMVAAADSLADIALGCGSEDGFSASVDQLVTSSQELKDELASPQWQLVKNYTVYGKDIETATVMLDSVDQLATGPLTDMEQVAKDFDAMSMKEQQIDASALMRLPGIVTNARALIAERQAALEQAPEPQSVKLASLLNTARSSLELVDRQLDGYDELFDALPQMLGSEEKRSYLVLIFNPAELRSGGGMVGTVGEVTADQGMVTVGDFDTTLGYDHDVEAFDAENEVEAQMYGTQVYRYAQMTMQNPDFQRAAITNMNLWKHQKGNADKNVAGVVAIDPMFLQAIVDATGSVTLSDGTVLDGTTTARYFLNELFKEHPEFAEQNDFVNQASEQIMDQVFAAVSTSTASALLKATHDASANGHFRLWMQNNSEFDALVITDIIDVEAAGRMPSDPATPVSGIYLNQYQPSKLDWYATTSIDVTKTCTQASASLSDRLSYAVDAPPESTTLGLLDRDSLGDEYTVSFTITNTLTDAEVEELPDYIRGEDDPGQMNYRIYVTAPLDGEITSVAYENATIDGNMIQNERQMIALQLDLLDPGSSTSFAYTVRVPKVATVPLNVTTTPIINANGIETGSNGKVNDECPTSLQQDDDATTQSDDEASDGAGSAVLDTISELRENVECPVDLRKLTQ